MNASYWNIQYSELFAPEASILVQNAPKSLAAGAPPQTPLGELTAVPRWGSLQRSPKPPSCYGLGWRFSNNFFWSVNCVPPCSWPVPPCCFEADYGPVHMSGSLPEILQYRVRPISRTDTFNTRMHWLNFSRRYRTQPSINPKPDSRWRSDGRSDAPNTGQTSLKDRDNYHYQIWLISFHSLYIIHNQSFLSATYTKTSGQLNNKIVQCTLYNMKIKIGKGYWRNSR